MKAPCLRCGQPRDDQRIGRGLCATCYYHERHRGALDDWPRQTRPRADVVQDAADLLAAGEAPERAAQRMGMTVNAIARALRRAGRLDLEGPFRRAAWAARRRRAGVS